MVSTTIVTAVTTAGDLVRFTTANGPFAILEVPIDPTMVMFEWRVNYDGEITTYVYGMDPEIIRDDTGSYHVDIDTTFLVGSGGASITGEFVGSGIAQAVGSALINVDDAPIPFS